MKTKNIVRKQALSQTKPVPKEQGLVTPSGNDPITKPLPPTSTLSQEDFTIAAITYELDSQLKTLLQQAVVKMNYQEQFDDLTFFDFLSESMLMVFAIKDGITFSMFSLIQKLSPFSMTEWSNFLNLSSKSLNRYRVSNNKFKSIYSERIFEIAEVTKVGLGVFDSKEQFKLWLETPNFALGKQKPCELLFSSYGKELVIKELIRIDQGIFA